MSKPTFTFTTKTRKNNTTVAVHAGPAGKPSKYVGTLTFEDRQEADVLIATLGSLKVANAEFHVNP